MPQQKYIFKLAHVRGALNPLFFFKYMGRQPYQKAQSVVQEHSNPMYIV